MSGSDVLSTYILRRYAFCMQICLEKILTNFKRINWGEKTNGQVFLVLFIYIYNCYGSIDSSTMSQCLFWISCCVDFFSHFISIKVLMSSEHSEHFEHSRHLVHYIIKWGPNRADEIAITIAIAMKTKRQPVIQYRLTIGQTVQINRLLKLSELYSHVNTLWSMDCTK